MKMHDTGNRRKHNVTEDYKLQHEDRQTLENYLKICECEFFQLLLTADRFLWNIWGVKMSKSSLTFA